MAILETQVSFEDIKHEIVPQNDEFWLEMRPDDPSSPKLRLKITYVQNEVLKWDAEVTMLQSELKNDAGVIQQVRFFIDQLRTPFGFLKRDIESAQNRLRRESTIEAEEEKKPDHKYYEQEKKMEQAFDNYLG